MDGVTGYHFDVQFGPQMTALLPLVIERARKVGIRVSEDGLELRPKAMMLRLAGTLSTELRTGKVHFQVLEYRSSLEAFVIQEPSVTSMRVLSSFGVREEPKGWIAPRLSRAVGLWIRDGSLMFHKWQDERTAADEEVVADFDVWRALDAMARLAAGEPSFGVPLSEPAGPRAPYHPQPWARDFTASAITKPAEVFATFESKTLSVGATVTLTQRSQ